LRSYGCRTEKNVAVSDGTLILNKGCLSEGTKLTFEFAVKHGKPCLVVQLGGDPLAAGLVVRWIEEHEIKVLNVAGPRESKCPEGIYREALTYLEGVFSLLKIGGSGEDAR
jgi:hypothetical protein